MMIGSTNRNYLQTSDSFRLNKPSYFYGKNVILDNKSIRNDYSSRDSCFSYQALLAYLMISNYPSSTSH